MIRTVILIAILACFVIMLVLALSSGTFIGVGLLGWLAAGLMGMALDRLLLNEWPPYAAKRQPVA